MWGQRADVGGHSPGQGQVCLCLLSGSQRLRKGSPHLRKVADLCCSCLSFSHSGLWGPSGWLKGQGAEFLRDGAVRGAIWVSRLFDFPLDGLFRLEIRRLIPFKTIFHFITRFWRLATDTKITRLHFLTEVSSSTGFVSWQLLFWGRIFFLSFFFFPDHFDKDFPPWGAPFPKDEQTI